MSVWMKRGIGGWLIISCILVSGTNASATKRPPVLIVSGSADYVDSSHVEHHGDSGRVSELRSGVSVLHPMVLKNGAMASFMMSFYRNDFYWEREEILNPGAQEAPWKTLYSGRIGAGYEAMGANKWGYFGGISFGASFEETADHSLSGNIAGGFIYKQSETLEFRFGAGIFSNASGGSVGANDNMPLFNDALRTGVMPFLGFSWNKNGDGFSAELNYNAIEAGYRFNRMLSVACKFGMEGGEYLLSDDNPIYPEGYIGMSGFNSGVKATLGLPPGILLTIGVSYIYDRKWEIFDTDGNETDQLDIDNNTIYHLGIKYAF